MTTSNQRFAQLNPFSLAGAGAVIGDIVLNLQSFNDINGNPLTMASFGALGWGTLEPGNGTLEEQISFKGITQNLNGTATLTGISSVGFIYPYTSTSGLSKTHAGAVPFIISNTAGFYSELASTADDETITGLYNFPNGVNNPTIGTTYIAPTTGLQIATKQYVDSVAIAGAPNATTTQAGIVLLSVNPVSGTPIVVSTNDTRVPTQNQKDAMVGLSGTTPSSTNPFVDEAAIGGSLTGVIMMYAGATASTGWLLCDGTGYSSSTYAALYAIIGYTYGGSAGTFNVPDMRGRVAIGVGTGIGGGASGTGLPTGGSALTAVARAGWKGEETHQLTTTEMPSHTHSVAISSSTGSGSNPGATQLTNNSTTSTSTGSDGAHNNIQPVMGLNFIIKY